MFVGYCFKRRIGLCQYYLILSNVLLQYYAIKCKRAVKIATVLILVCKQLTYAQGNAVRSGTSKIDTLQSRLQDSTLLPKDTLNYTVAQSDLKAEVIYEAQDSIIYDAEKKIFLLYSKGKILYDDLDLQASEISFNTDSSTLEAYHAGAVTDTTELPVFKQGEQVFTFDSLRFNFKSQRALVQEAHTKYGEGYITSEQVKRNQDQSIYGLKSIYSTCELDTPHFGIYAQKIKVIPNVVGISGPARLYIESIPTPVILPFALYPLSKGQKAGFILPTYGFEVNRGFGLRSGGYYFPINDYVDLKLLGDIYTYGSWRFGSVSTYTKKYSYGGSLEASVSNNKIESEQFQDNAANRTFSVVWSHRIDPRKLRNANFNAMVRITSSNNNKFNFNQNVNNYLENKYGSSITYSKTWTGKPYNLTLSASHNQDNSTRLFEIRLPEVVFTASGLTPFARKIIIGKQRWYEKININYNSRAINNIEFYDTAFSLARVRMNDFKNGIEHKLSTSYNVSILKYFNFGMNASYNEFWYSKKTQRNYNSNSKRIDTVMNNGFYTARDFRLGASLSTTIYGTKLFKKGTVRGLRHTMVPSLSFGYNPDFTASPFNSFYQAFLDSTTTMRNLSYYEGAIIGRPTATKSGNIGFSVRNSIQAKIRDSKDTSNPIKKVTILDNLNFNINYDLAADSFALSELTYNYSTSLLKGKLNVNGRGSWDPYGWDYENRRRDKTLAISSMGKLARFRQFEMNLGTSFRSLQKSGDAIAQPTSDIQRSMGSSLYNYYDFTIPWDVTIDAQFRMSNDLSADGLRDSMRYNPTVRFGGNVTLTENWKLGANTGYDFKNKQINLSEIRLSRDLHCWEMSIIVIPFGGARSYNFALAPKSSMLHDLRVTRQKSFWDYR
jgi:hypothetical protein